MKRTFVIAASACLLTAAGLQAGLTSGVTGTVWLQSGGTFNGNMNVQVPATGVNEGTFTTTMTQGINFDITTPPTSTLQAYINTDGGTAGATLTASGVLGDQMSSFTGTPSNPSGSGNGYSFEIVYTGTLSLNAGDTINVSHDDGIVLVLGSTTAISSPAPTTDITSSFTATSAFTGSYTLYYEATHGNPSITQVSFTPAAVPEPTSIILLGTTFLGLGTLVRKKFRKA